MSSDFSADNEPHPFVEGLPDSSRCACGRSRNAPVHGRCEIERRVRIRGGITYWCATHNVPENAGHAFDTGRINTLD